jgi:uncharacterized protein YegJ (DUF2314 family)
VIRFVVASVLAAAAMVGVSACKQDRSGDPVVRIPKDDPRLAAATQEAQQRWPEFVTMLQDRKPDTSYAVKRAFPVKAGGAEHMWVQVESIDGTSITGRLDNDPVEDVGVTAGQTVTFQLSEMEDWLVAHGSDDMIGAFSVKVLRELEKEKGGG